MKKLDKQTEQLLEESYEKYETYVNKEITQGILETADILKKNPNIDIGVYVEAKILSKSKRLVRAQEQLAELKELLEQKSSLISTVEWLRNGCTSIFNIFEDCSLDEMNKILQALTVYLENRVCNTDIESVLLNSKKMRVKVRSYAINICDKFEDILDEHGIDIPDDDREGAETEAHLYGTTYVNLEDSISELLLRLLNEALSDLNSLCQ